MKNNLDEKFSNKKENNQNDEKKVFSNLNNTDNINISHPKNSSENDSQESKDKSFSIKLKIPEHYEIKSKENISEKDNQIKSEEENKFESEKNNYINDYYSEESEKNSPKIIDGKTAIDINEILGEESSQPITLSMLDDLSVPLSPGKISAKSFGVIKSYAANTNQGIVRDYNEDRVSVIINMNKPKYYSSFTPWPKISYFGVFDGHAGNKCAEFLRDNLLNYICNNNFFPNDIPNAIKYGFKKIDEDYLKKYAFINNILIDNSGSCGLILLIVNNIIYIANVGDSRCIGSFQNGKIQKDITLDHKPNTPYEKERIINNGGKIYQTQTPIEDDESFKDKILVGPYRVLPGKLSVSRTVGDAEGKIESLGGNPNVIVPIPDIFSFDLEKDDIDFFILGCDGIYDQLYSKDIFNCVWMVLNNNLELYKKNILENNIHNNFKGNYGNKINMNTSSGNIVDLILKASMIRKSFDNVTCLFISFKNFFENVDKNMQLNEKFNNNLNGINKITNREILLRNKSNLQNENSYKMEPQLIFKERNKSQKALTKDNNNIGEPKNKEKEDEISTKNKNGLNVKKIKGNIVSNKKKIRINSLPKQPLFNMDKNKNLEENLVNLSNNQNFNKNMTVNNIITYNNNIYLNTENNKNEQRNRPNSFNEKIINNVNNNPNLNYIHNPTNKDVKNIGNNNILNNSSNQILFTKMHITGINTKNKNRKEYKTNNANKYNKINNEENYRHTSYNKKIRPIFVDNTNDMDLIGDNTKKEKYVLGTPNNIIKKINYKKINEAEYFYNYGNGSNLINLGNNNIRSNSHTNNDYNKYNIKPIILKTDKYQEGNNYNFYQNNHNIKFNNIIKKNNYGILNNKLNNNINNNNFTNLKNITLTRLKKAKRTDEIKVKRPMPTLGQLYLDKNNKLSEENNFSKQRRFITNDNVKRKSNLSEHKKLSSGNYKIELNLSNKNNPGIGNKINNLYNKNGDINKLKLI